MFTESMSPMGSEGAADSVLFDHDAEMGSVVCLYSQLVCVVWFFVWMVSMVL